MFTHSCNYCVACHRGFFFRKDIDVVINVSYKSFCLIFRKSKVKVDKYVN